MEEILHQLRLVVDPIIYRVLYIPGGAGFLPPTAVAIIFYSTRNRLKRLEDLLSTLKQTIAIHNISGLCGGFNGFLCSPRKLGKWSTLHFSKGLKPPSSGFQTTQNSWHILPIIKFGVEFWPSFLISKVVSDPWVARKLVVFL